MQTVLDFPGGRIHEGYGMPIVPGLYTLQKRTNDLTLHDEQNQNETLYKTYDLGRGIAWHYWYGILFKGGGSVQISLHTSVGDAT